MSSPELNTVVNDIHQLNPNSPTTDYSHVVAEIGQLQRQDGAVNWSRDEARLNSQINTKQLGFNDNFTIEGVDKSGNLITRSGDGQTLQTRDPVHLGVTGQTAYTTKQEQWGSRKFDVNSDGSAQYTVQKGDNFHNVVRDALSARMGKPPSETQIMNTLGEMKNAYGIKNMNLIHPGDKINIPMPKPEGDGSYQPIAPSVNPENNRAVQSGDNVLAPDDTGGGQTAKAVRDPDSGNLTTHNEGHLADNSFGWVGRQFGQEGTPYTTDQTVDSAGNLVSRHSTYGGDGANLTVTDDQGQEHAIPNVTSLTTFHNPFNGNYETTLVGKDGQTYRVVNQRDGAISAVDPKAETISIPPVGYM